MQKDNIYTLFQLVLTLFVVLSYSLFLILVVEMFTYSGFFIKHTRINGELLLLPVIVSGLLSLLLSKITKFKAGLLNIVTKFLLFNLLMTTMFLMLCLVLNLVEALTYYNYIFSKLHIQPSLMYGPLLIQCLVLTVNVFLIHKFPRLKIENLYKNKRILLAAKYVLSIKKRNLIRSIIYIYTLFLVIYISRASVTFIVKFYEVDYEFRQQNELRYFTTDMDISEWIGEYFPKTKDLIYWCESQNKPVDLVVLDPEIIWMNYEALSRVFLTNCNYVNISQVSKTYDYLDNDELLLVSISQCDPDIVRDENPRIKIVEDFRIMNNDYICMSREIVPGLYLYKNEKRN